MNHRFQIGLAIVVCAQFGFRMASAQVVINPSIQYSRGHHHYQHHGWHSPGTALSARVHAQADLVRATGSAAVDFDVARRIRADSIREELNNSVERVEAYWERKRINEEEKAKRRVDPETMRRRRNSKTWQRLRLHPDVSAGEIARGDALNFLMYRLSATALAWDPSEPPAEFDSAILVYFRLSTDLLHKVQLQQTTGSSRFVFRADEGVPLKLDWWPYLLRREEFNRFRENIAAKRQAVIDDAADGEISVAALEDLEMASMDLSTEYRKRFDRYRQLSGGTASYRESRDAQMFLRSMDLEIARLQRTGDASAFDQSLRFDVDSESQHLPALVAFMARNGLKFAPPQPGEESAYFTMFQLLRDFYLAYDDADEGIQDPKVEKSTQ
jgi:hypothetical protein